MDDIKTLLASYWVFGRSPTRFFIIDGSDIDLWTSKMLLSVVLAVLGFAGGAYCVVISSLGILKFVFSNTLPVIFLYHRGNYLFNQTTWSICKEPENIILWNIILFSILLAIGVIEAVLCFIQVINGLTGFICGTSCCY
uniref:Uncharacterized protein n=1 Tax=Melopsittacus undulatus TaxID=13146 RepID=A0A8V5FVH3_MELUD